MDHTEQRFIVGEDDPILITGAGGFIGSRLVKTLLERGFRNLRCFCRSPVNLAQIKAASPDPGHAKLELIQGNLLSPKDCIVATQGVSLIFHLAAARGEKSFPEAFSNSVVTTRNLLEASLGHQCLRRFVNVSSFAVYTNRNKPRWRILDESCPVEARPEVFGSAYSFAKAEQDKIVVEYGDRFGIPFVIIRPGWVYGPGNEAITGRVGTRTFGFFLHLGGPNEIPLSYVDNCADAIALAGLTRGVDGEVFNVVDDDLPSSRTFLRLYKRNVLTFTSIYLPHLLSYILCSLWQRYSAWSQGQLPPVFNRSIWHASWKKTRYSNHKLKQRLGWMPTVSTPEGLRRYFNSCRGDNQNV